MKTRKPILPRLFSLVLVALLALAVSVPAFAAENLTITIKNNEGLPGMKGGQFTAYQLFTGTPTNEIPDPQENTEKNEWGATHWNDYSLANVEWGANINGDDLMAGLKAASKDNWSGLFAEDGTSYVQKYMSEGNSFESAADLAKFLVGKPNSFLQEFSRFVMEGSSDGTAQENSPLLKAKGKAATSTVSKEGTTNAGDESTITVEDTGYYLIVENGTHKESDAVSEYILAVLGDQTINLKASVPTVDKNIVSGAERLKGDAVGISDTVIYELTGTLPKNFGDFDSYEYYFHDTLSKGLTYNPDTANLTVTVTLKTAEGKEEVYTIAAGENGYTVANSAAGDDTKIEIKFSDLKTLKGILAPDGEDAVDVPFDSVNAYNEDVVITVTYQVTVNENAKIGSEGNPNAVYLEYSNDPNHEGTGETEEKRVVVYTFALELTKVGSDNAHDTEGLEGAGFLLSKKDGDTTYYAEFENVLDEESEEDPQPVIGRRLKGWVAQDETDPKKNFTQMIQDYKDAKKAWDNASHADQEEESSDVNTKLNDALKALAPYLLESGANGKIPTVSGVDAGDYTLKEVITPAGYNTMADIEFTIEAVTETEEKEPQLVELSGTLTPDTEGVDREDVVFTPTADKGSGSVFATLTNQKAPFLPFTGGIGTLIFYVLGIALIGGAVTYLVIASKKRKKSEENA